MKEATGELNMTVVTVVAIAAVGAFSISLFGLVFKLDYQEIHVKIFAREEN